MKKLLLIQMSIFAFFISHSASNDNNVEWDGVQVSPGVTVAGATPSTDTYRTLDYSNNQTIFYLRVYRTDITSANVVWRDGISGSDNYVSMAYVHNDGTFDYWRATLSKQNTTLYYVLQINDGTDTDWGGASGGGANGVVHDNQPGTYSTEAYSFTDAALPVSLLNFSALLNQQNQANLSWSTASEINASHFSIHRSDNGVDKQEVGVVNAQGNSNEIVNYAFVDAQPINGQAFYFLEQVDFDGKVEWFGPVKVSVPNANTIVAAFGKNNEIIISLKGNAEMEKLSAILYDMQGKLIKSLHFSGEQIASELSFTTNTLPAGVYMLYLQSETTNHAIKLTK